MGAFDDLNKKHGGWSKAIASGGGESQRKPFKNTGPDLAGQMKRELEIANGTHVGGQDETLPTPRVSPYGSLGKDADIGKPEDEAKSFAQFALGMLAPGVGGAAAKRVATGSVARSAARAPGAVKEAIGSIGVPTTIGGGMKLAKGVGVLADEAVAAGGRASGIQPWSPVKYTGKPAGLNSGNAGAVPEAIGEEVTAKMSAPIKPTGKISGDPNAGYVQPGGVVTPTSENLTQKIRIAPEAPQEFPGSSLEDMLKQSIKTPKKDWAAGREAAKVDHNKILAKIAKAALDGTQDIHGLVEHASQNGVAPETIDGVIANAIKAGGK